MTISQARWAFVAAVTVFACGAVWTASAWPDTERDGVSVHEEEKSPEEIRKFWTPERVREAEPADMPVVRR